jgi:hypothetical protein
MASHPHILFDRSDFKSGVLAKNNNDGIQQSGSQRFHTQYLLRSFMFSKRMYMPLLRHTEAR